MNAPTLQMRLKRIAKKLADLGQSNQANTIYEAINRINALENADSSPNSGEEFFFSQRNHPMRTILCEADSAQNCNCRLCEAESALAAAVEMVLKDTRGLGLDCDPEGFNEVQHYYVRHHEGDVISSSPDLLTACVKALKGGGE